MFLYFNGDSYVAGAELGDDILPDYPGMLKFEAPFVRNTKDKVFQWYKKSLEDKDRPGPKILQLERERCFAGQIAQVLKMPYLNNARGGSSMDRIVRTSILDLLKIRKQFPDEKIKALIGTTSFYRFEAGTTNHSTGEDWICSLGKPLSTTRVNPIDELSNYRLRYETNYHSLVRFYKNVIQLKDFCKANDIDLFWIAARDNDYQFSISEREYPEKEELWMLKEYANLQYQLDMFIEVQSNFLGEHIWCPGGHFGKPVHDLIARKLIKIIKGEVYKKLKGSDL